ncbi:hypothetical protein FB567DRAFT_550204 [Paraphoma chrysanthemicola]|uniref:Uncharacterized protein n=1 Tax=Paraphoma chrysanthemicola TaxID=798071 RepID=A0A8K0R2J7_9PLEO|nr:hypothetical protein FB567DRAFT_550204 [Paraphoma chrysanthemicola]
MLSLPTILTSLLAIAAPIAAQSPSAQIVANLELLTSKTEALQPIASSISIINGPLIIIGQGPFPQIISGLQDIVTTAGEANGQIEIGHPIAKGEDADAVFWAYKAFATAHQSLLTTLTERAGLFDTVPFIGQPVFAVLRADKTAIESLSNSIIHVTPTRAHDLASLLNALSTAFDAAIAVYEGILQKRGMRFGRRAMS